MEIFDQIVAALPQHIIFKLLFVFIVLLVLFLLIIYIIGYFSSSYRYEFYRRWDDAGFTVTRYFMGLFPIHKKRHTGLRQIEVENYIYRDGETDQTLDCARVYVTLKSRNQIDKRLLLPRLTVNNYRVEINKIACDIKTFIQSRQLDTLVIHHCRMESFAVAAFVYAVSLPFVLIFLWSFGAVVINALAPADSFPIIDNTFVTRVDLNNPSNEQIVWLKTNSYNGAKLAMAIKESLHALGWETSRLEDFSSYDSDGNLKPKRAYIFYLRDSSHTLEGNVIINKSQGYWDAVITIPMQRKD